MFDKYFSLNYFSNIPNTCPFFFKLPLKDVTIVARFQLIHTSLKNFFMYFGLQFRNVQDETKSSVTHEPYHFIG